MKQEDIKVEIEKEKEADLLDLLKILREITKIDTLECLLLYLVKEFKLFLTSKELNKILMLINIEIILPIILL